MVITAYGHAETGVALFKAEDFARSGQVSVSRRYYRSDDHHQFNVGPCGNCRLDPQQNAMRTDVL
jgi:hypothetical protein